VTTRTLSGDSGDYPDLVRGEASIVRADLDGHFQGGALSRREVLEDLLDDLAEVPAVAFGVKTNHPEEPPVAHRVGDDDGLDTARAGVRLDEAAHLIGAGNGGSVRRYLRRGEVGLHHQAASDSSGLEPPG
jgi:hypothetical protein